MKAAVVAPLALLALAICAAPAAWSQDMKDAFKGRMKEGLYQIRSDADLTAVPGMPKESARRSETRETCVTKADLERGIQAAKDCKVKSYKAEGKTVRFSSECTDGSRTDMRMTFSESGFVSETTSRGTHEGKPFVSRFRSEAKLLGPCKDR